MIEPIYTDETLTLYNTSMENIIQHLTFDYVITDPPYNVGYKYPNYKDNMSSEDYIKMIAVLRPYKTIMIHYAEAFCGDIRDAMGRPNKVVAWVYNSNLNRQHRSIAWFGCQPDFNLVKQPYKNPKDKRIQKLMENGSTGSRIYDWWNINLIKNVSNEKIWTFTNQIPIEVLERIILTTTKEGDTILYPFFGSGSLYFVCKKHNRKCIGVEQSSIHIGSFYERLKMK